MTPSADDLAAVELAELAGELLLGVRDELTGAQDDARRAEGDARAHRLLVDECRRRFPDDGFLSEEGLTDGSRHRRGRRTWIVDPLDGTREFAEGRDDWAVHVALVVDGRPVSGAVALPAQGVTLSTGGELPRRRPLDQDRPLRLLVSRSRPPQLALDVAKTLGAELVAMGSAGAKASAVVRDLGDVYLHAGGQYEWDSAAPVAVALAAGLHASRIDARPLVYDQPEPWLPDLLVCAPEVAAMVLAAIAAAGTMVSV